MVSIALIFTIIYVYSLRARISKENRKFSSTGVDEFIEGLRGKFKDEKVFNIFENAYPNTLDTTIQSFKVIFLFLISGRIC